jgi:N-sulfoglucosamine sulfohydrolase
MTHPQQPNILFVFADDWGRYASAYGEIEGPDSLNALLDTPHFDRVAREGALFTNAFVPAPSCTPCRSSVLTGRYFWQTGRGAILQGAVWDDAIPSYPLLLEEAGYHIGYTYKVWSPGTPADQPYGGARTRYSPGGNWYACYSQTATSLVPDLGVVGAKARLAEEVRQNFDAFLAARPAETPFCYWWGPTNTHREWQQGSGKALWGIEPDDLQGRLPAFLPDVPAIREDVADYLGECQAVDAGLGVLLQRLEELGELDNTLIVVSGDHGIPGFPRGKCNLYDLGCEVALAARWPGHIQPGRIVDDLVNIMDLAPTFLQAAGVAPPDGLPAQGLLPVLEAPGSGQIDPARTVVVTGRERHVGDARDGFLPYPQRAIRTKEYLYIRNFTPDRWPMGDPKGLDDPATVPPSYEELCHNTRAAYADLDASPSKAWLVHHRGEESVRALFELGFGKFPAEELYDLRVDPDYMRNVVDAPAYSDVRRNLSERLLAVLQEQADPRVVETPCRFEEAPFTDPV